jgi:hypothetical protein
MVVREPEAKFAPAPAGVHAAVCVDEIDMGLIKNHFQPDAAPVPTVRLVWQIAEDMSDGKPFLIKKDYRASLHEKAALRKDLEAWRGRPFTPVELLGFDLETVVGVHCMLNVIQKQGSKGGTFANIAGIMPLAKGMMRLEPRDYMRVKDRPVKPVAQPKQEETQDLPPFADHIDDDDVPF